ncbi:polyprenol monophosphomannose synthase [Blastopirellula sp. JC732]|uniref:Polyprenol monophosphomannose synthase n=1 Tax=Blastopirellula sediminis TaxID=2894196 RepID=A0A9X1MGV6_9BACT|nr:polyprenol monophosphomannose synthase [Blastopirellula sediminis]MCC9604263.1 polyprenol monophosphomannose synthase [Blastopirellula sediminis]MCC9626783.1 polyprenol monophosphomannose synthase [Blastopirellula sediminis]
MSNDRPPSHTVLIAVATFNEIDNLPLLVAEILDAVPDADILVVDDDSPDGTGKWCQEFAANEPRLSCMHRARGAGLGTAVIAAMKYAIDRDYDLMVNLDADFSHTPQKIVDLLAVAKTSDVDVVVGSRYVAGGGVQGWPLHRRFMSRGINFYTRLLLGLPVRDCSGSFRCYRVATLARLDFDAIVSKGYSFFEEILWRFRMAGATFCEVPYVFVERERGYSKINWREAVRALYLIARLGLGSIFTSQSKSA